MIPPVVSNSSPLIALTQIGRLDLLQRLFNHVLVPPSVIFESAPTVAVPEWMTVRVLTQAIGPRVLGASLGKGESEAISLALEVGARWVILDDRPARRLALACGLPVIGTLGILLAAKQRGLLIEVRPCLDALAAHDFRIAPSLYDSVLADAGETK